MASRRMFVSVFWICLISLLANGNTRHVSGITLVQFCNCWRATITRTGNDLRVAITVNDNCWKSPSQDAGDFQIIPHDSNMLFKIGIKESLKKLLKVKELQCQLNRGCFTTVAMVRNTSLEIVPDCKSCHSCMGKETGYLGYINQHRSHHPEDIRTKPMKPSVQKPPYKSRFLVMTGVVSVVIMIAAIIILMLACRIYRRRNEQRGQALLTVRGDPDELTDVSAQMEPVSSTIPSNTPPSTECHRIRRPPVKIGVVHTRIPKEFSSETTESPLDICVQRMISLLNSVQELEVNYLKLNFSNLFDEIDKVSSSPKIILVLSDRFCELSQEGGADDVNATEERWTDIERTLLKRIREQYYLNGTFYFVNFKHFKQQDDVLGQARAMFPSHSYKVYSVGSLDQRDDHFKELLDSILFDVIGNPEERSRRIFSILCQERMLELQK